MKRLILAATLPFFMFQASANADQTVSDAVKQTCIVEGAAEARVPTDAFTPDEQALMALETKGCWGLQMDASTMIDWILADDAYVFPPAMDFVQGKENQRELFVGLMASGEIEFAWQPADAQVSASGDMGWVHGRARLTVGDNPPSHYKYVSVWEKIDGEWKNMVEMRNSLN